MKNYWCRNQEKFYYVFVITGLLVCILKEDMVFWMLFIYFCWIFILILFGNFVFYLCILVVRIKEENRLEVSVLVFLFWSLKHILVEIIFLSYLLSVWFSYSVYVFTYSIIFLGTLGQNILQKSVFKYLHKSKRVLIIEIKYMTTNSRIKINCDYYKIWIQVDYE
jgi:hypothetical protein